jgi:nucleoside-diphosphate-sugar epimerase
MAMTAGGAEMPTAGMPVSLDRPVAVIGANGFIGGRLHRRLTTTGMEVGAFTRQEPFCDEAGRLHPDLYHVETLFFLATTISPAATDLHPDRIAADYDSFVRLLDALGRLDRPPLVVLAGTSAVYDPSVAPPYREDSPVAPRTRYGRVKQRLERELAARRGRVPGMVLRLANVYGPGQRVRSQNGVMVHWMQAARRGAPLCLYGNPSEYRDYVYVEDVVDAMRCVCNLDAEVAHAHPVLNIGSGKPTSLDQLLRHIAALVDDRVTVEMHPARPFELHNTVMDVTRARSVLGWEPSTPLPAGLARMWAEGAGVGIGGEDRVL